ncbi:MAG: carbohydrate porin [Candidatus Omnitrophota bacterium]|nr:carbohydrate porin [Candidatus Omnitrophota bacterium]
MKKITSKIVIVSFLLSSVFLGQNFACAKSIEEEISELKVRIAGLEKKLGEQQATVTAQEEEIEEIKEAGGMPVLDGLNIGAGATFVTQLAVNPNSEPNDDDEVADATYSIDIEIEKTVGENGLAFIHLEAGDGTGLDSDEITTFSAVNRDAANSANRVEVTEVWYEHTFFDETAVLTAGKIDPTGYLDENEIANDETSQFLSAAFRNSTALEFPDDNTYGVRLTLVPADWSEITVGYLDDNANWESVFEDPFLFAQVNLKPVFLGEGRPGNYRVYSWYDDTAHAEWGDTSATEENFGFGLSADQKVLDYLTLFGRVGWEDPDVSTVELAWSSGLQLDGIPWGRDEDYVGAAIGMDIPGDEYENSSAIRHGDPEGHLELYYNAKINDNLHVSPHYQLVWNPNGQDDDQSINIFSLRGQVDF